MEALEASLDESWHRFVAESHDQAPPIPCLFVHGKSHGIQVSRKRPRADVAVEVQQVVECAFAEERQHLARAAFHEVHGVESTQDRRRLCTSRKTHQIQHSTFAKMSSHRSHQRLHRDNVPECTETCNEDAGSTGIGFGYHVPKVALRLSSQRHVLGRHPHPFVPARLRRGS